MSILTDPARYGDSKNTLLLKIATLVQAGHGVYDPDAAAFFAAAGITDPTQKSGWNAFVLWAKSYGIWSKFHGAWPLIGGTANQHKWNAVTLVAGTFTGAMTHNANGITGNGVDAAFDTGHAANDSDLIDDLAFGVYNRTSGQDTVPAIGANGGGAQLSLYPRFVDDNFYYDNCESPGRVSGVCGAGQELGLLTCSRTDSDAVAAYSRGTLLASGTNAQGTLPSGNFQLLSITPAFSIRNISFAYVAAGLTATEVDDLDTAVQTLQTILDRQV